jgi:hypothetical protein
MQYLQLSTADITIATGTTPGKYHARAFNAGGAKVLDALADTPAFPWDSTLPVGTYQIAAERLDTGNRRIGTEYNGTVEWVGDAAAPTAAIPTGAFIGPL